MVGPLNCIYNYGIYKICRFFVYRNIRVVVYSRDHLPPHVHVLGPGFEVLVRLDTLEATSKTASLQAQRVAVALVRQNLNLCWERWNENHQKT